MSVTEELLDQGLEHHQAGHLREAEQVYQHILRTSPGNADALHLLGLVYHQQGRHEAAIEHLRRAIGVQPSSEVFWANLSAVFYALGRNREAADAAGQVLRLNPNNGEGYFNLGCALQALGDPEAAAANFRRALQFNPNSVEAHLNLGTMLRSLGLLDEAARSLQHALNLSPGNADAHSNLGMVLRAQGRLDEAACSLQNALQINPNHAETHSNLGVVLTEQGKPDDAARSLQNALELDPNHAEAHSNLGVVLTEQRKLDEAARSLRKALELNPDYAEAHYNLGNTLHEQGKPEEAARSWQKALALNPNYAEAHYNLGNTLSKQGKLEEAVCSLRKALEINPAHADAHFSLGLTLLQKGSFEAGWPHYEWRWRTQNKNFEPRQFSQPPWDGRPLQGQCVLVHAEQGLGDTLQFVRYAPLVRAQGCRVILECQPSLRTLLSSCPGVDRLVARGDELLPFDYHVPLLSLPRLLDTHAGNIPADVPYLFAREDLVRSWRQRLSAGNGFKVGICWQGSLAHAGDPQRSFALAHFAALAEVPGVHLFSLQKGVGAEQLGAVHFAVTTLGPDFDDTNGAFMDTAAVMKNLDLVVTSDTALAHLAGALGAPVWVALARVPDWRWQLGREDSPWYPTMRLFRQDQAGDWGSVFRRMAEALRERTAIRQNDR
jgi:tetratricopeptide (TPR) repeat protein